MKIAQHFRIKSRLTNESVKRTTEIEGFPRTRILLSALFAIVNLFSAVRFANWFDHPTEPSDKSLGYFHVVRSADDKHANFLGKARTTGSTLKSLR